MRAHAAMSPNEQQRFGLDNDIDDRHFFLSFCLSLHECPGGAGSLMRQTLQPFRGFNEILESTSELEAYPTAPDAGDSRSATVLAFRTSVMFALSTCSGVAFPNARREEVDRLRVAAVSCVRGLGREISSNPFRACGICC